MNIRLRVLIGNCILLFFCTVASLAAGSDLGGVNVALDAGQGSAIVESELVAPFKLRLTVNPKGATAPLAIRVELPQSGPRVWPAADVDVRQENGTPMIVRRPGIEWFKLTIPVPPVAATYFVQAIDPHRPTRFADTERVIDDGTSGLRLSVARWPLGKAAALSIRFDDSHPTHLDKAVPILDEYGFKGTFMVNPGPAEKGSRARYDFESRRTEWGELARRGNHELANHSAHHRGAKGDDDMDAEIGTASKAIRELAPKNRLLALNLGGGTYWETTRPLRYYLDKYTLFDAGGSSTGMDDRYGNRVENLRRMLDQHIERGLWLRIHYHYIGDGLSTSEANFRAAMDAIKDRLAQLWVAGMSEIHKYQTERDAARLTLVNSGRQRIEFRLSCGTDPTSYDRPLTIEVAGPETEHDRSWIVHDSARKTVTEIRGRGVLRFELPPSDATYALTMAP